MQRYNEGIFRHIAFSSQDNNTLAYDGRCIGTTLSKLQVRFWLDVAGSLLTRGSVY
jgi:hypothetical protein